MLLLFFLVADDGDDGGVRHAQRVELAYHQAEVVIGEGHGGVVPARHRLQRDDTREHTGCTANVVGSVLAVLTELAVCIVSTAVTKRQHGDG